MSLRTWAAPVLLMACAACSGPRAVQSPDLPVTLSGIAAEARVQRAAAPAKEERIANSREDELHLAASDFDPPLAAALDAYFIRELGSRYAGRRLALRHATVKIKSLGVASDSPERIGAAVRSAGPMPAGAGLVGALVAAGITGAMDSRNVRDVVIVNLEGDVDGMEFAGFAYTPYQDHPAQVIEATVMQAFSLARDSVKAKLPAAGAPSLPPSAGASR